MSGFLLKLHISLHLIPVLGKDFGARLRVEVDFSFVWYQELQQEQET